MVSELVTGLGLFKSMMDTAKGLKDISDAAVRNTVAVELQEKILAAQEAQSTLVERVRDLEKEVARFETWDAEKQRYQLTDFGGGTFAYALKEGMAKGEPPHRICAPCYEKGQKSILQFGNKTAFKQDSYTCPACKTDFKFGERGSPPQPQTRGGTWGRGR